MYWVYLLVMLAGFLGLQLAEYKYRSVRARALLRGWARKNGFEILHTERRWEGHGPFSEMGRAQVLLYARVRDDYGRVREVYARIFGRITGILTSRIEIRWADERTPIQPPT